MDRFASYKITPSDYIPNNIEYKKDCSSSDPLPSLVVYDALGKPIGFTWSYGESIYIEFTTTGNVVYDAEDNNADMGFAEDAATYFSHKTPSDYPKYNDNRVKLKSDDNPEIVDEAMGICSEENQNTEDSSNKSFEDGIKIFQVLVYNFRHEVVAWCEVPAAVTVRILSDSFYPSSLVPGIYKLQLNLIDKNAGTQIALLKGNDCTIFIA